jgi:hypothetical protein
MNLLDIFKRIISKNHNLSLDTPKEDLDATQELIQLNTIEELIQNPELFNKFLDFENNRDVFGNSATTQDYAKAVKTYVDFMKDKGIKFNKAEKRRIKDIEKLLPKTTTSNDKGQDKNSYKNISKKALYSISHEIIFDEDTFNRFLESQATVNTFQGIPTDIINRYLSTEMSDFYQQLQLPQEMMQRLNFVKHKNDIVSHSYKVDSNIQINPNFEQLVMSDIKPGTDIIQWASEIYNNLNKNVKYDSNFFAHDQDLSNQFLKSIYNKKIENVSKEDNTIVCKTWAELYAYLLGKNNIEAYVVGDGKHKSVKAFIGTTEIDADATNITSSFEDLSHLTDLTRSKLGYKSTGFEVYEMGSKVSLKNDLHVIQRDYTTEYSAFEDTPELTELLDEINDTRDLTAVVMEENGQESPSQTAIKKLSFINSMIQKANLDNMDSVGYIQHLFHNILDDSEKKQAFLSIGLYEESYNACSVLPLVSVRNEEFGEDNETYSLFMYNQDEHKLSSISKDKVLELVANGQISISPSRNKIKGLPELEFPKKEWSPPYLQPTITSREAHTNNMERYR